MHGVFNLNHWHRRPGKIYILHIKRNFSFSVQPIRLRPGSLSDHQQSSSVDHVNYSPSMPKRGRYENEPTAMAAMNRPTNFGVYQMHASSINRGGYRREGDGRGWSNYHRHSSSSHFRGYTPRNRGGRYRRPNTWR